MWDNMLHYVSAWLQLEARLVLSNPPAALREFWEVFGPGGRLHPKYFLEHQYHLVIEGLLLVGIVYLVTQRRAPAKAPPEGLTDAEVDELVKEWQCAPLVPHDGVPALDLRRPVLESAPAAHITVDGRCGVLNLAAANFWGLSDNADVQKDSAAAIDVYGIGSCGPRAFYGSIDAHLRFEADLAAFMQTDQAIVYSFDIATMPSVLPAFASSKDVIVMDEAASWPLRQGARLSRARVEFFRHNDMVHLEELLAKAVRAGRGKPLNRRFIVVEGIYATRGDRAPIAEIYALKQRYKFRLVVDESLAFGVLGPTGRGACEAAGLEPRDVEIVTGSLGTGLASMGGFCTGATVMVEHQRLNGSGYCFSASPPPVLSVSASRTLRLFAADGGAILERLRGNAAALRAQLVQAPGLALLGRTPADDESPVLVLTLASSAGDVEADVLALARVRDTLLDEHNVLVALQRPTHLEPVAPALVAYVCADHGRQELADFAAALKVVAAKVLRPR